MGDGWDDRIQVLKGLLNTPEGSRWALHAGLNLNVEGARTVLRSGAFLCLDCIMHDLKANECL